MVFYLRQLINQSQASKGHKSLPRYSNLKLKPNLQADVVIFKGKENVLSQEQKALNNLNALLKQNIINPELNTFLTKEVNSKNKNVIKYLNEIKASNDPNLKGHKAVAERLVANHSQLSGAIASMKSVDDETKQQLDFDNQKRMVHGINEIYTKDKDVKTEETNGEIGFGGRKDRAMKIVKRHTALAGVIAGDSNLLTVIPVAGETLSVGCDIIGLMANEFAMVKNIAAEYGLPIKKSYKDALITSAEGTGIGTPVFATGTVFVDSLLNKAAEELTKEIAKQALLKFIPFVGPIVGTGVACVTTNMLGKDTILVYQQTGKYD